MNGKNRDLFPISFWHILFLLLLSIAGLLLFQTPVYAAITYFASAPNPADGGSLALTTVPVTPPGAMQVGDLVVMVATAREPAMALTISTTGGQTWTSETANTITTTQRIFWARYNGAWSANPSVSFPSGASGTTLVMHVFRPTSSLNTWAVDVALTNDSYASPGAPRDVTINGINTVTNGAVVFAIWTSRDSNTWALQTTGWTNAGGAQYRNTDGSDVSQSAAYKIMPTAGASGNVTNRQATIGGDAGNISILAFKEVPMNCFTDDFNRTTGLGSGWNATSSSGSFGVAQIVNNRLRLTDTSLNVATAAHLQNLFPGAGNKIVIEFDHFAYGGSGADGIAVTLSDATITTKAGAYGGSLGYAQRTGVNGFAGGWLGVGIDEYGNFANPTEGRSGGPGFTVDSVTTRGSGSGTTGYAYHATSGTLNPGIDQPASITHVGAGAAKVEANGTSVTPTLPAHQANDLLLCAATSNDDTAHSVATSGWAQVYQVAQSGSGNPRSSLFYKKATSSSEASPTITHSGGGGIVAGCSAFRGVDTTTPFDVAYTGSHYADTTNSSNVTSGSMTTATGGAMMLFVGHINNNRCNLSTSVTGGLTWAESFCWDSTQGADETIAIHYATKPAAGAIGPITFTQSNTDENRGVLLALRPLSTGSYRYRITIDHSNNTNAYVTVERNTGSGYTTIVPQYDAKTKPGQAAVPTNWLLSYTGSTGASTNIHEIDNLSVCTLQAILPVELHHVRLNHTGSAVICAGEQVTVYACNNPDSIDTCTANTGGLTGNVLAKSSGGATLATVPFTIAAGSSSTVVTVPVTAAQTVTFETSGLSVPTTISPAWTCWNGSAPSCSNTFSDAGFIFANTVGGAEITIPTQVAGVSSGTYYLRAIKTNTITKACEAALAGANTVNFAYECNDPTTCYADNLMSVNGGTATTITRNNNGSGLSYTSVNMTFDANGNAPFTFSYGDVGKVRLHTTKAAGGSLLSALTGSSNAFVVKPYDFGVIPCAASVVGNCTAVPADPGLLGGGNRFAKAGEAFKATITARTATGTATPSFGSGSNNATETVNLTRTRVAPTGVGTVDGTLGGTVSIPRSSFSNGIVTASNLTWSEVGVIILTATNNTFLGNALTTTGTTGNLGRFVPDHFAITAGSTTEGCDVGNFTYFGQDGFSTAFTLTAQNTANNTTANYTGSFAKFDPTAWSNYNFTAAWLPAAPNPASTLLASVTPPSGSWSSGVASITAKHLASRPAAPVAPADITVNAKPTDTDGVTMASAVAVQTTATPLRYGRLRLPNAYGTETEAVIMPARLEYYNGSTFELNTLDSCTNPGGTTSYQLDNNLEINQLDGTIKINGNAATTLTVGAINAGIINLTFSPPGSRKIGYADATALLNALPWLQYEWDGLDSDYNENPTGRINFGIYRGNDRIINWREVIR